MNAPSSAAAAIRYISKTIPVLEASTYISILYLQVSIWLCLEVRIVEMVHSNEPILSTWRIRGSCRVHGNSIHRPLSVDVQTHRECWLTYWWARNVPLPVQPLLQRLCAKILSRIYPVVARLSWRSWPLDLLREEPWNGVNRDWFNEDVYKRT